MSAVATQTLFRYTGQMAALSGAARDSLFERTRDSDVATRERTAGIIGRVRREGDGALIALAKELDGVTLANIEVPPVAISSALKSLDGSLRSALARAARNIESVHRASVPSIVEVESEPGVIVGRRPDPFDRVGVYAPGGRAAYASSVLMCAIPARIAGVEEVIVCSPPGKSGLPSEMVLAACAIAKVDRVFAVGGAGAIAAMAYGTETIPRASKIVGPGNAYVAEAKLQVSRVTGIDSPAGPSELLVICDDNSDAEGVAAEVLAQAEHDDEACVVVIATSAAFAEKVSRAVERGLPSLARRVTATNALRDNGALLVAENGEEAIAFSNEYAPEHLLLLTSDAETLAARARNAGCVFVGAASSVVFGDYISGGNHVLPTAGSGRSYSGLGTLDFVRWTSFQRVTPEAARRFARDTALLADAEGLGGHASAALRFAEDE